MYKHVFLEAESGAGKSTLIRKLITPYIGQVGGIELRNDAFREKLHLNKKPYHFGITHPK